MYLKKPYFCYKLKILHTSILNNLDLDSRQKKFYKGKWPFPWFSIHKATQGLALSVCLSISDTSFNANVLSALTLILIISSQPLKLKY